MDLPKKPVAAAFRFFMRAHVNEFRNNKGHHMKLASAKWKTLRQEDKKEYEATGSFIFLKVQFSAGCQCTICSPSELQQCIVLNNLFQCIRCGIKSSEFSFHVPVKRAGPGCRKETVLRGASFGVVFDV